MTAFIAEQALIPYTASSFSARRVLVLAPHPDDEVFGCGAALADLASRGAGIDVLVLTDGAGGEQSPAERVRIADLRLRESGVALAILGGGKLRSAGLPDRGLCGAEPALRETLGRTLEESAPDLVFAPSPVEIHPDHRAVACALVAVAEGAAPSSRLAEVLAGATVAFFELSQPFRPNFLFDCGRHAETKRRAMLAFVSQNGERDYAGFVSGLNAYRRMTLPRETTAAEGYFVVPATDLARGAATLSRSMSPFAESTP
ncbi:MAG: PIG-L deacetylase family protein [Thermoanaerobaculia bacterium]